MYSTFSDGNSASEALEATTRALAFHCRPKNKRAFVRKEMK